MRRSLQIEIRQLILLISLVSVLTASWLDLKRQGARIEGLEQRLIELQQKSQPIIFW